MKLRITIIFLLIACGVSLAATTTINGDKTINAGSSLTVNTGDTYIIKGKLTNYGTIINNGTIIVEGTVYNHKVFTSEAGSVVEAVNWENTVVTTGSFWNRKTYNPDFTVRGEVTLSGSLTNGKDLSIAPGGTLTVQGALTNTSDLSISGELTVDGTVTNEDKISIKPGASVVAGNWKNDSKLSWWGTPSVWPILTIDINSELTVTGNFENTYGSKTPISGTFNIQGNLINDGGRTKPGEYGLLDPDSNGAVNVRGAITNTGFIAGSLLSTFSSNLLYARADGDWDNGSTWSYYIDGQNDPCGCTPDGGSFVYLNGFDVQITNDASAYRLHASGNSQLSWNADAVLTIGAVLTIESGSEIKDNSGYSSTLLLSPAADIELTNEGVLQVDGLELTNGALSYSGAGVSTLGSLTNNGNISIASDAKIKVTGNLNTNNSITLQADANSTAALIVEGTATGTATVQTYTKLSGWNRLSAPVANYTNQIGGYQYNEATDDWWLSDLLSKGVTGFYSVANQKLIPGMGQIVRLSKDNTLSYTGNLVTDDVTVDITYTTHNRDNHDYFDGWNDVGNPYSAPINWAALYAANVGKLDNVAYFYTGGDYSINATIESLTPDGHLLYQTIILNNAPTEIPVGQCVSIKAKKPILGGNATYTLRIPANARTLKNTVQVEDAKKKATTDMLPEFLYFRMEGNGSSDETAFYFSENSVEGYSEMDVYKQFGNESTPHVYVNSGTENTDLAIDGFPYESMSKGVDLGYRFGNKGVYTLILKQLNFDPTYNILLEDTETGDIVNILAERSYTFTANTLVNRKRFKVHFTRVITDVEELVQQPSPQVDVVFDGNELSLRSDAIDWNTENARIAVVDMQGRVLKHTEASNITNGGADFQVRIPDQGIYIIQIQGVSFKHSVRVTGNNPSAGSFKVN